MSAYHHGLPHGAGLIMISKAFAEFFIEKHACDQQFIKMARAMGIPVENVGVKATTTEHLGFEGREEGISATAVCILFRRSDEQRS